jgi:tRNA(fMet)-specific endonuclease VapC
MSLHVFDTDILSLLQDRDPVVTAHVASCRPEELAITVISVEEQLSGWYRRLRRVKKPADLARVYERLTATAASLAGLRILSFTEPAIHRYQALQSLRLNVGRMDLRIAAIALEHQAGVVTRNVRDFQRIPNLVVEDWSK